MPAFDERERAAVAEPDNTAEFCDAALRLLEGWLPSLSLDSIAELVGMSTHQLQHHRQEGGASPHRLQLVTQLVAHLRHSWTAPGVYAWFHRERLDLGGRAPIDLLADADRGRDLLLLALAGRAQSGN